MTLQICCCCCCACCCARVVGNVVREKNRENEKKKSERHLGKRGNRKGPIWRRYKSLYKSDDFLGQVGNCSSYLGKTNDNMEGPG